MSDGIGKRNQGGRTSRIDARVYVCRGTARGGQLMEGERYGYSRVDEAFLHQHAATRNDAGRGFAHCPEQHQAGTAVERALLLGCFYSARRLSPRNQSQVHRRRVNAPADNNRSRSDDLVAVGVSQLSQNANCARVSELFDREEIVTVDTLLGAVGAGRK